MSRFPQTSDSFDFVAAPEPVAPLIGLLLPAVQKVREAAARMDDGYGGDFTGGVRVATGDVDSDAADLFFDLF